MVIYIVSRQSGANGRQHHHKILKMSDHSKLYVGNLPFTVTAQDLETLFGQAGTVRIVEIIFDKFTGRSRGFAFVSMATNEETQKAVERFHNYSMDGRLLTVSIARSREEHSGGGYRRQLRS